MMQKQQAMAYHAAAQAQAQAQAQAHAQAHHAHAVASSSATSQPGSLTHRSGAWQSTLSGAEGGRGGQGGAGGIRGPQLVIPRAKVKPRSNYQGYNSDDDRMSAEVSSYKIGLPAQG